MWILTISRRLHLAPVHFETRLRVETNQDAHWSTKVPGSLIYRAKINASDQVYYISILQQLWLNTRIFFSFPQQSNVVLKAYSWNCLPRCNRAVIMHANYARFNGYSGATGGNENSLDSGMSVSVRREERLDTRRAKAPCPCLMFRHVFLSNLTFCLLSPPASSLLIAFHTYGVFQAFFSRPTQSPEVSLVALKSSLSGEIHRQTDTQGYGCYYPCLSCAYTVLERVCILPVIKWGEKKWCHWA